MMYQHVAAICQNFWFFAGHSVVPRHGNSGCNCIAGNCVHLLIVTAPQKIETEAARKALSDFTENQGIPMQLFASIVSKVFCVRSDMQLLSICIVSTDTVL
jgi:hypothetical protein